MSLVTRSEFREVLLVILKDIQKLREQVAENHSRQQKNQHQISQVVINTKLDSVSSIETRTPIAEQKQEHRYQCWSLFIQGLTLVAVAAYAIITAHMWSEMQTQTKTAQKQFEAMDRPWVVADISFDGPVVYDNGVNLLLIFSPKNVGRSPAQNVWMEPRLVPGFMDTDVSEEQKKLCDGASKHDERSRYFLIPSATYRQPFGLSMSGADNDSLVPPLARSQGFATLINVVLIGCIDYTYESSTRHHQTVFAYDVLTKEGLIPAKKGSPFPIGSIILRDHPRGRFSAN
jgi:hypothetical protein